MKKSLLNTLFLFLSIIGLSQANYVRMDQIQGVPMTITYNLDEEREIEGARYYDEEWKEIKVNKINDLRILIPEGKLDIYLDEIIIKTNNGLSMLDKKNEVESFFIDDKKFITSFYSSGLFGYLEELYKGSNVILYKKKSCLIQRGKPSNGIIAGTPDKFIQATEYFVKEDESNGEALKLRVTKRKILLQNNKILKLSEFLDDSKARFKSEEQLIDLFKQYDESIK